MSTSSNGLSTVLGSFGAKLGLVNTGIGIKNTDGTYRRPDTLQYLGIGFNFDGSHSTL